MNVAELLVRCLEAEGTRYVFGLPGEENMELLHAIKKSRSLEFVLTRDERGASFMAAAWGRLSGRPGVCVSTLGPGAINMLLGVADAFLDFAPLVAVTAQKNLSETFKEAHQYEDIFSMYRPVTKWGASIRGKNIPEIVRKAFRVAQTEKPGPAHLELPEDAAGIVAEGEPMAPSAIPYPEPPEEAITAAISMIRQAENPIAIAGGGVIRAGASGQLLRFIRGFGIPAATTFMAMGAVPADEELYLSTVGLQQRDYISCGLEQADLIIAIGYDPVEFSPRYWRQKPPAPGQKKKSFIHIGATPAETDVAYQSFELVGDINHTLRSLLRKKAEIKAKKRPYFARLKEREREFLPTETGGYPLKPLRIIREMRAALGRKDVLISDVGAHKFWIARFYQALSPGTVLISNGLSSMGFAIPSAISAKLLCPERKVIAAVGDGGFLMSLPDLETAQRLSLSFTVLIWNDGGYGLIGWKQRLKYGEEFFTRFGNPDFGRLAESFGARSFRVEKEDDLGPLLKHAVKSSGVSVIDCPVDYNENLKLTDRLGEIICPM